MTIQLWPFYSDIEDFINIPLNRTNHDSYDHSAMTVLQWYWGFHQHTAKQNKPWQLWPFYSDIEDFINIPLNRTNHDSYDRSAMTVLQWYWGFHQHTAKQNKPWQLWPFYSDTHAPDTPIICVTDMNILLIFIAVLHSCLWALKLYYLTGKRLNVFWHTKMNAP